jgi:hypothetical protein
MPYFNFFRTQTNTSTATPKKYIYILEGKCGRLENGVSPKEIVGMCTNRITSCNIIILISQDKKRYVLLHADKSTKEQHILDELNWAGTNSTRLLYRRKKCKDGFTSDATLAHVTASTRDSFTQIFFEDECDTVSVSMNDTTATVSVHLPDSTEYHPQVALLYVQHRAEPLFSHIPPHKLDNQHNIVNYLLFNITTWTHYPNPSLSPLSLSQLAAIGITDCTYDILDIIYRQFSRDPYKGECAAIIFCYFLLSNGFKMTEDEFMQGTLQHFYECYHEDQPFDIYKNAKIHNFIFKFSKERNLKNLCKLANELQDNFQMKDYYTYHLTLRKADFLIKCYQILFLYFPSNAVPQVSNDIDIRGRINSTP